MKRILSTAATLSLSLAVMLGGSAGAYAHDDEQKTTPEQGSTVEAGRIPIVLTFGEELLVGDDSISHEIWLTNEAGEMQSALCASAEGFELSSAAALDQPGTYTVTWRTVSADGHPVSGKFDFKLENTTDYDAATDAVDGCVKTQLGVPEPSLIAEPDVIAEPVAQETNTDTSGWLIAAGVVAVGAIAAVAARLAKARGLRRKSKTE